MPIYNKKSSPSGDEDTTRFKNSAYEYGCCDACGNPRDDPVIKTLVTTSNTRPAPLFDKGKVKKLACKFCITI